MTTTAPAQRRRAAPPGSRSLAGTGALVGFYLRRDRVKLPVWLLAIAVNVPFFYGQAEQFAATPDFGQMLDNPLGAVFVGPISGLEQFTVERFFLTYYIEFLFAAAVMSILLVTRHTRQPEQHGQAELVRAGVVGRHAPLTAAMVVAVIANAGLCLLIAAAMTAFSFPAGSAWLFGAGVGVTGLAFAAVAAVTAQLTEHSRAAAGLAVVALGVAWTIRAAGALQDTEGGPLAWLSPMAWAQLTRVTAQERWWPLALTVVFATVLTAAAYALASRRDLGAGLVPPRLGPATAAPWLRSALALAVRLQRRGLAWWSAALVVAGVTYGSLANWMDTDLGGDLGTDLQELFGDADIVRAYLSLVVVGMTMFVGGFAIRSVRTLRNEETGGLADPLLASPTSRRAWMGTSLLVTAAGAVALLLLSGLATGLGAAAGTGDGALFGALTAAFLARVPEVLALLALAAALYGLAPRWLGIAWAVLVYGGMVRFWYDDAWPQWLINLSLLNHIPRMPLEGFSLPPLLVLTALAAALAALGLTAFRRRDLEAK